MRTAFAAALLLLIPISPLAAQSVQSRPAAGRDTVVIGRGQEPDTLNPLFQDSFSAISVIGTLFTKDVQIDNQWRFSPQGVEYLPNVADGTWTLDGGRMTLRWRLRRRAWHDGVTVTCGDYVFTLAVARDPRVQVQSTIRFFISRIASISCPRGAGGRDVAIHWRQRDAFANLFPMGGPHIVLPRHVLEPYYRVNPGRLTASPYGFDPAVTIGDGAYRLREWRKGVSVTVEAVLNHAIFGTPRIRRITWVFFDSPEAANAAMLAGTVDVLSSGIPFAAAQELDRQAVGRVRVIFETAGQVEYMAFNLDHPLLRDARVRRAVAHGINRIQITQQLFQGRQPVAHTYLPPKHPGYTDDVMRYPHDPSRARALLRQAGFTPGPDGIMQTVAGDRLSLELSTAPSRERTQGQQMMLEQLKQIGIDIRIVNFPARVFFSEILPKRRSWALAIFASTWGPGATCEGILTSNAIPTEATAWSGGNYPAYRNAEMDRLCAEADREVEASRRNTLLKRSARILARDLPLLPLYYRVTIAAVKPGLQNFSVPGLPSDTETWNAHAWYWR